MVKHSRDNDDLYLMAYEAVYLYVDEDASTYGVFRLDVIRISALCDNLRTDACSRDWFTPSTTRAMQ